MEGAVASPLDRKGGAGGAGGGCRGATESPGGASGKGGKSAPWEVLAAAQEWGRGFFLLPQLQEGAGEGCLCTLLKLAVRKRKRLLSYIS